MSGYQAQGYTPSENSIFLFLLRAELDFLKNAKTGNWHTDRKDAKAGLSAKRDVHAKARIILANMPGVPMDVRELTFNRYLGWLRASGHDAKFNRYL